MDHEDYIECKWRVVSGLHIPCTARICLTCWLMFRNDEARMDHQLNPDAPKVKCRHCIMVSNKHRGHQVGMAKHIMAWHPDIPGVTEYDYDDLPVAVLL